MSHNFVALSKTILSQLEAMQQLLDLLREEYDALSCRDYTKLIEVVERKQSCTDYLLHNEAKLTAIFKTIGAETDNLHLETYLEKLGNSQADNQALVKNWRVLMSLAEKCKEQNQINGRIINSAKLHTKQLIDIFQGSDNVMGLYNNSGRPDDDNNDNQSIAIV